MPPTIPLGKPLFLDPKPQPPVPPLCPTCRSPAEKEAEKARWSWKSDSDGKGPNTFGPFKFSGGPNIPSISDLRDKDPLKWFTEFKLKLEGFLNGDFTLPKKPNGPDPDDRKDPNPNSPGPQCRPNPAGGDPPGCDAS
jgi:hypothetical protein